jgi:hypothetical protein
MIDQQGTPRWIPTDAADDAKMHGYTLHPDSMKPPVPTKNDDTALRGEFGTAALPKDFKGNPNAEGALASDDEVNARAAAFNASLSPSQKKALGISDHIENVAGNTMLATGVAGNVAVAATAAPAATSAGLRYLGRGALPGMEELAGKAAAQQGAKWAAGKLLRYGLPAVGGGSIIAKILGYL